MSAAEINAFSDHEALIQFLYLAPVGLVQTTLDGEIVLINPISAQLLMPLSVDGDLENLFTVLESVAPDLRHRVAHFDAPHGLVCEASRIQLAGPGNGRARPQMLSLTLLKLDNERLMAVVSDITEQVRQERLLKQNEAWLDALVSGVTDYALVRLDHLGCIEEWNASIGRVTGFSREAAVGQPFSLFYPPGGTTPDRVLDRLREADENGWSLDDGWRMKSDGTRFWGSAMISPMRVRPEPNSSKPSVPEDADLSADAAYCLVIRDITDKREANESQRIASACDHLTGIANRRTFYEQAELELARGHRSPRNISLIMIDADHFKTINDRHGHAGGDAVLRDLAQLMAATFREVDVVARIGGEEFAVLLPSTSLEGAVVVAERLRDAVTSRCVSIDGTDIRYTVSAGVTVTDSASTPIDVLMRRADAALYNAKRAGRNRVEIDGSMPTTAAPTRGATT